MLFKKSRKPQKVEDLPFTLWDRYNPGNYEGYNCGKV